VNDGENPRVNDPENPQFARRKENLQARFSNLPRQKKTFFSPRRFEIRLSRLATRKESLQARFSNLPRQKKTFFSPGCDFSGTIYHLRG
jgi:hypothetical protein